MKLWIVLPAIQFALVAAQADLASWAKYDHCPAVPSTDCAHICISPGSDLFCAANDPITPRVYCNACPTTGDECPAIYDENCSYLCADIYDPNARRCVKDLPDGAPNVLCAGCPGAPSPPDTSSKETYNPTVATITIGKVTVTAVSTVTATVSKPATTSLPIPPIMPPTYGPPGNGTAWNGTGGNATLTVSLPQPTFMAGGQRVDMGGYVVYLLGAVGVVFWWL